MTVGEKIRNIRQTFGYSQEELAQMVCVSRQAITKWENDKGLPDISNLQELATIFHISVDDLLNDEKEVSVKMMTYSLDKENYKMTQKEYVRIIQDYYGNNAIHELFKQKNHSKLAWIVSDFILGAGAMETLEAIDDMTPYYLVIKEDKKLLVHIHDYMIDTVVLADDISMKKFTYGDYKFKYYRTL